MFGRIGGQAVTDPMPTDVDGVRAMVVARALPQSTVTTTLPVTPRVASMAIAAPASSSLKRAWISGLMRPAR